MNSDKKKISRLLQKVSANILGVKNKIITEKNPYNWDLNILLTSLKKKIKLIKKIKKFKKWLN